MNIFSWLVMAYSLNMGMIVNEWGDPIVQEQPYFIEYGVEFTAFNFITIESYIENIFIKAPIRDQYTIKLSMKMTDNLNVWASHYCRHTVVNPIAHFWEVKEGIQSETRIGINISN